MTEPITPRPRGFLLVRAYAGGGSNSVPEKLIDPLAIDSVDFPAWSGSDRVIVHMSNGESFRLFATAPAEFAIQLDIAMAERANGREP